MSLKVCLAGATGWAGSELARGIAASADLELVAAVSRRHAGRPLGAALGDAGIATPVFATAAEALATPCDVFVEYTHPDTAKANILAALAHGAHVVVGTSGLTDEDYAQIDAAAREHQRGVLACGNFALTAVLLIKFAEMAAKLIPQWEIIDYASAGKLDVPSGTARELAERLGEVRRPAIGRPLDEIHGPREARGADVAGTRIHSVRIPSFVVSTEVVFGAPDERLTIRHDAGGTPAPYVAGTLLAVRRVPALVGLTRGLDTLLLTPE
jgi:4-hydroxy-tetrahydrodipicolinate reductase